MCGLDQDVLVLVAVALRPLKPYTFVKFGIIFNPTVYKALSNHRSTILTVWGLFQRKVCETSNFFAIS